MGSKSALLPLIADCERGLGRPERAIELARDRRQPSSAATMPTNCVSSPLGPARIWVNWSKR
ncbi:hypothetical protein I552_6145 [Mycobacterium xenopi 3993]|nr:hypothetical protein I552_6145 [Mycobacterium xenopi 3993]